MKAKLLKSNLENFNGVANLYELDTPLEGNTYIVVSGVIVSCSGPETYIFPSDEKGNVLDYGELEGSFRGDINHNKALENAGYEVE